MANGTMATPNLLTEAGFLYWAPLGTSLPTHTVVGSVFSDTWPVGWIALGMTDGGSTWSNSITVQEIDAAETYYPLQYRTTGTTASAAFSLKSFTATNLSRATNGATLTVTGSTTTTLTKVSPPTVGQEVRCMIGFESIDSTVRIVGYQCINSGDVALAMAKAPANTNIPFTLNFEKPSATPPWEAWTAGIGRG
jgi:hypothetical protein